MIWSKILTTLCQNVVILIYFRHTCSAIVPDLRRVAIQSHYKAGHRPRGLSARTSSPRRSSASALSGSALRITFSRYALSEKAGRNAILSKGFV